MAVTFNKVGWSNFKAFKHLDVIDELAQVILQIYPKDFKSGVYLRLLVKRRGLEMRQRLWSKTFRVISFHLPLVRVS